LTGGLGDLPEGGLDNALDKIKGDAMKPELPK
jgi:hypothetical protein